jgi:hypothetical protein
MLKRVTVVGGGTLRVVEILLYITSTKRRLN